MPLLAPEGVERRAGEAEAQAHGFSRERSEILALLPAALRSDAVAVNDAGIFCAETVNGFAFGIENLDGQPAAFRVSVDDQLIARQAERLGFDPSA